MPSPQRSRVPSVLESLIEEWIPKLAINAGAALDARTQAVFKSLWLEGLGDLSADVLRTAFVKTLRECAYWPVKVADIRKHVTHAEETAEVMAAKKAWEKALEFRQRFWHSDLPGQRTSDAPKLSHRFEQSMLMAGVLKDYEDPDQLHVWVKKNFVEYYLSYIEMEKNGKFLLPQGELRDKIFDLAEQKALPIAQ